MTVEHNITLRPLLLLTQPILSEYNTCDAHQTRYEMSVEICLEKETAF